MGGAASEGTSPWPRRDCFGPPVTPKGTGAMRGRSWHMRFRYALRRRTHGPHAGDVHLKGAERAVRIGTPGRPGAAGLTQKDVAKRARVSQTYVSRLELGWQKLTVETMSLLAGAVGLNVVGAPRRG